MMYEVWNMYDTMPNVVCLNSDDTDDDDDDDDATDAIWALEIVYSLRLFGINSNDDGTTTYYAYMRFRNQNKTHKHQCKRGCEKMMMARGILRTHMYIYNIDIFRIIRKPEPTLIS